MDRFVDGEERQRIALNAMEAVEDLLATAEEGHTVRMEALGALIGLVFDASRRAMPLSNNLMGGAND